MVMSMSVLMMMVMCMTMLVAVEVIHIVVMVLLLKYDVEVAGIDPGFLYAGDAGRESGEGKASQCITEFFMVHSQVKERGDSHIAADP